MSLNIPTGLIADDLESTESALHSGQSDEASARKQRQDAVTIPILPKPLAVFCLVANIFIPGSGTLVSAFSFFCFHDRKEKFARLIGHCLSNSVVAVCQLVTVIFLVGWIWSIIWGCAIVGKSKQYMRVKNTTKIIQEQPTIVVADHEVGT